ncbi:MAG: hypothetical protein HY860_06350 [Chlamydiales bacterium]|nr:hypothetical protein [Chlamydiales bacterium]
MKANTYLKLSYNFLLLLLCACSGLEQSQNERIKRNNEVEEFIYRNDNEKVYPDVVWIVQEREKYPWEEEYLGTIPKITKEYFRCKGKSDNKEQIRYNKNSQPVYYHDCGGVEKHSLPLMDDKEFIYPVLINILNYIQQESNKRVVITCGHRCPKHNLYADKVDASQRSKHQVGAEVDFYVEGLERQPKQVIEMIQNFYQQDSFYKDKREFTHFFENKEKKNWYNKEIVVRLSEEDENRDFDNRHPYPYLTIEIKYDIITGKPLQYNWQKALNGYMRW